MARPFLKISDLSVTFSSRKSFVQAVRNLSFELKKGKTLAIVGESGCGKSSVCQAILGLHPENTSINGSIQLNGQELVTLSEKEWNQVRGRKIAMIFQDPMTSLNPTMKIGNQIIESLTYHKICGKKEAKERAITLLDEVGIPEPRKRFSAYPHTFSGGMRQRVVIAIALACEPTLLIADEPTTALDVTIQAQILNLLTSIQKKRNLSILLVTHDLAVVSDIADEVLVMYGGKEMEIAKTSTLFSTPSHPYSKALLESIPTLGQDRSKPLTAITGRPPSLSNPPSGCPFWPRCSSAMRVCQTPPPFFQTGTNQKSACWLHHEMAKESV